MACFDTFENETRYRGGGGGGVEGGGGVSKQNFSNAELDCYECR